MSESLTGHSEFFRFTEVVGPEITGDPGEVFHVGFAPDSWSWAPWRYATDSGLFDGRWDDQLGEFRTLYTADSLLGCFLELLAWFRPSAAVAAELAEVEDDDGSIGQHPEAPPGAVGYSWLNGREYGAAMQTGRYWAITHSRNMAALIAHFPLGRHGLSPRDVDTALLKDARDRDLTRSIARWLCDLGDGRQPLVDGVEFSSRHGDEIRMWAVFERPDSPHRSVHLSPTAEPVQVQPDLPELVEVFGRFGLSWYDD